MTYVIETIAAFDSFDNIVRAEVFTVDGGKPRVRVIDVDTGEVLPTIPTFKDAETAIEYAKKCVR